MRDRIRILLPLLALLLLFPVVYAETDGWDSGFWDQWQSEGAAPDADGSYADIISDYESQQAERDAIFQGILNGERTKGKLRDVPEIVLRASRSIPLIDDVPWELDELPYAEQPQGNTLRIVFAGALLFCAAGIAGYLLLRHPAKEPDAPKSGKNLHD